jgi:hypothetical protein
MSWYCIIDVVNFGWVYMEGSLGMEDIYMGFLGVSVYGLDIWI